MARTKKVSREGNGSILMRSFRRNKMVNNIIGPDVERVILNMIDEVNVYEKKNVYMKDIRNSTHLIANDRIHVIEMRSHIGKYKKYKKIVYQRVNGLEKDEDIPVLCSIYRCIYNIK